MTDDRDDSPDWQQQQEAERERYEETLRALNSCAQAGAKPEALKVLARECGLTNWNPKGERNASH